jgi:hypothetical protein
MSSVTGLVNLALRLAVSIVQLGMQIMLAVVNALAAMITELRNSRHAKHQEFRPYRRHRHGRRRSRRYAS